MPRPLSQPQPHEAPLYDTFIPHYYLNAPPAGFWPSGAYFGDAGGGKHNLFPTLRRVGIGVVHLNSDDNSLVFAVGSPLFGEPQTVHRGEAASALLLLTHLAENTVVDFYGDNDNFVEHYNKGYDFCRQQLNASIYVQIFQILKDKNITLNAWWMPSHLLDDPDRRNRCSSNPKPTPAWVGMFHKLGNQHADNIATEECRKCALPDGIAKQYVDRVFQLKIIQMRIACVFMNLLHRIKHKKDPALVTQKPQASDLFCTSTHVFPDLPFNTIKKTGQFTCSACHKSCSSLSPQLRSFLNAECAPVSINKHSQVLGPISINGIVTHPSHRLVFVQGVFICNRCGYRARTCVHKLADPCNGSRTVYGQLNWNRVYKDTLVMGSSPRGVKRDASSARLPISIQRPRPVLNPNPPSMGYSPDRGITSVSSVSRDPP